MKAVAFYFALPFIYLVSILPFPLLYGFSEFVRFFLYHVFGYRRKVVMENLRNSFPEKTPAELKKIESDFYRYLCDLMLETFKTLTVSPSTMLKHCYITPQCKTIFEELYAQKQNSIIVMGHLGNWEWAGNAFGLSLKNKLFVIYHPLANPYFNNLIVKMRYRFGNGLIPMRDVMRQMLVNRSIAGHATAFIADQTPQPERAYWMNFLNQDTPVFLGTEKFAQKLALPIVYVSIKRIKRGEYALDAEMLIEDPTKFSEGQITEIHTKRLEKDIVENPAIWLWSHRRWKHKRQQPTS